MENISSTLIHGHLVVSCFTLIVLTLIGLWEIYSNFNKEKEDNLNIIMYRWSEKYYFLSFIWGIIGGHLFFGFSKLLISSYLSIVIVAVLSVLILFFDHRVKRTQIKTYKKVLSLLIGFLFGHYVWTMNAIV